MKNFLAAIVAGALVALAGPAAAEPSFTSLCSQCHIPDATVVTATFEECVGTEARYRVAVDPIQAPPGGWAVFSGSTNIANSYLDAGDTFTVEGGAGEVYDVYGVGNGFMQPGSAMITWSPGSINTLITSCNAPDEPGVTIIRAGSTSTENERA